MGVLGLLMALDARGWDGIGARVGLVLVKRGETQAPVSEACSAEGKGRASGALSALHPGDSHDLGFSRMAPLPPRSLPESSRLGP